MSCYSRLLVLFAAACLLRGASPTAWEMTTYQDFLKGKLAGLSLRQDGRLTLAPRLDTLFSPEDPAIWSIAELPGGSYVLGTGHRGRLYRVDASGRGEVLFAAPEPEIFAVAVDSGGRIYAATSPNGKIYRIENGKAAEFFAPGTTYIWSLVIAPDGTLYAGTGNDGKIYRITAAGQGEVYYDTGQSHVTSLALDARRRLLAGTEPNGILYRVEAKDKAFVLYDANLPEIRALASAADGTVYAAAMGGSVARQTSGVPGAAGQGLTPTGGAATSTSITVEGAQGGVEVKPKPEAAPAATPAATGLALTAGPAEYTGVEKSAIYRIHPDNTVETLWSSKEENAYDLIQSGTGLLFSTDGQGRLYRIEDGRRVALIAETAESEALRLLPTKGGTVVATGNQGKLLRLGETPAATGSFESPVHDTLSVARWGRLSWSTEVCAGCSVALRTRSGNSARPDKTWSDWSDALTDSRGSAVASPNARYAQWKAELRSNAGAAPSLDSVRLAYLPQNSTPQVKSVNVSSQVAAAAVRTSPAGASSTPSYSITVTDSGEAGASSISGTATQPVTRAANEQLLLSWQAEDADGDRLIYSVHFRGEQEREWKLLKDRMTETSYTLDAEALADGRYFFRVTASDALVNPAGTARQGELASSPVLVDRTPPVLTLSVRPGAGGAVEITIEASDAGSPLVSCEYSVNAGAWTPLAPQDGIVDSSSERFVLSLAAASGERLVVVRAYDLANNAGLGKTVLR